MKIAYEAPTGNTALALVASDYIFAIAPMLKIPEYAKAVQQARDAGKELYIDNGEYEGQRMEIEEYLQLCYEWKPQVVVAPDVFFNFRETCDLVEQFILAVGKNRPFKIMLVPQGTDNGERWNCYERFRWNVEIIGLGLGAFEKNWRERFWFASRLRFCKHLHVLGIANIHDLCLWKGIAETVDTSLPFHLAQEGKDLFAKKETKHLEWEDTLEGDRLSKTEDNIWWIRELLKNV